MANFTGNTGGALFRIFARRNGIDVASIKEIVSAPAAYHNPLIVGQADFAPTTVNQPVGGGGSSSSPTACRRRCS